jgi:hypothetical protein
MEESFDGGEAVRPDIALTIERLMGRKLNDYCEGRDGPLLEAKKVDLGPGIENAILVKPAAACLCGVRSCHYWIFRAQIIPPQLLAEIHAHSITIASRKNARDFSEITSFSGSAIGTSTELFRFDGKKYKLISTKTSQ